MDFNTDGLSSTFTSVSNLLPLLLTPPNLLEVGFGPLIVRLLCCSNLRFETI